jgi:hypothetical protein
VAGGPAVQHEDWRAIAGNLYVDFFAIVGKEMRHGKGSAGKNARVSQAGDNGNNNCHLARKVWLSIAEP